jgi:tRNA A37 threonylcarbamoyladenosine biosynthesis protein TsaE
MQLLERERQIAQLHAAYTQVVSRDAGVCAVLSGDAGIGKTSLVHAFLQGLPAEVPVLL